MKNIGAIYSNGNCTFRVWAPKVNDMAVKLLSADNKEKALLPMNRTDGGYWELKSTEASPGDKYFYTSPSFGDKPDPASFYQPDDVHGPSQIIDHDAHRWQDEDWKGIALEDMIFYELHVGTFTPEGTFDGVIGKLDYLAELGITAIEIMPVAQFPGGRNWGYDGTYPFAVHTTYGGVEGLKRLVDSCHRKGLAVVLDVVYNHLGPEGNYLNLYAPYFTDDYHTAWGWAINFDGHHSDDVRNYFIGNALYWFEHFHIDALRLDAVHAIIDRSAQPFLQKLAQETEALSQRKARQYYLIAESDLNDSRLLRSWEHGGFGLNGQWADDFHHSLHTALTGEAEGYYQDFKGVPDLAKAISDSFVFDGQFSSYRQRSYGNSVKGFANSQFVVFTQNHDQVGNRMLGERLSQLVSFEALKIAAGAMLLSPYLPLLFMGEEYGETRPFQYFVSHGDKDLIEAVRKGRKEEFREFAWKGEAPDPEDEKTFTASKLSWDITNGKHKILLEFYRRLIALRKEIPALRQSDRGSINVNHDERRKTLCWESSQEGNKALVLMNFDSQPHHFEINDGWDKVIDSADPFWGGQKIEDISSKFIAAKEFVYPLSFILYKR